MRRALPEDHRGAAARGLADGAYRAACWAIFSSVLKLPFARSPLSIAELWARVIVAWAAASDIWPETARGVVTLTGTVPTAQQRAQAEQVAKRVRGIRAVKNQLKVKAGA